MKEVHKRMKWSNVGLSLTLAIALGVLTARLDEKHDDNRHFSNTISDKLKALDRKLYMDGKKRADILEAIKKSMNEH